MPTDTAGLELRRISVSSCCDYTDIVLALTDAEYAVVQRIAAAIELEAGANTGSHHPVLKLGPDEDQPA